MTSDSTVPYPENLNDGSTTHIGISVAKRPCPDGGALNIMGEHFPCQQMDQMSADSTDHKGWAHSNRDAEAIWQGNVTYSSEIENYAKEGISP